MKPVHHHDSQSKKVISMIDLLFDSLYHWLLTLFSQLIWRWNGVHQRWKSTIILYCSHQWLIYSGFSLLVHFAQETEDPIVSIYLPQPYAIHSFVESLLNYILVTEGKLKHPSSNLRPLIAALFNINLYVSWHCSTYIKTVEAWRWRGKWTEHKYSESWHALFLILIPCCLQSKIHYADSK